MTIPTTDPQQGVSNPPDNGQVTVAPQNDNDTTISQDAAPNNPSPQTSPTTPVQNTQSQQTPQQPGQQQQQQQPGQQSANKQPDLSKPPVKSPAQVASDIQTAQTQAKIKKAGVFHDIAETLAGGPRYTYNVDAYGNTQKQKVPVSNAHLALAIAMEALSGAAAGFSVPNGSGVVGRAAAAGFQEGNQQRVQQDQQARQQSSEDFARRAQVTETNMRMYANARNLSKQDAENIDQYVNQYKDLAGKLQTEYPGFVKGIAKYSDLAKYHVTLDNAIPYMRVPRLDQNGKQVETNGIPQWDIDYLVLDPNFKATGVLSKDDLQALKEMGQPWAANDLISDTPLSVSLALNKKTQAAQWTLAKGAFDNFYDAVDSANNANSGTKYNTTETPTLPAQIDDLAKNTALKYKVDPNLIRGIISQESGGNPNAKSPTGVKGVMQVSLNTAKQYGLSDADRTNPAKSIDAGTHYFSDLLNKYKDPKLALAAYYSGDGAIHGGKIIATTLHSAADTKRYVNDVTDKSGLEITEGETPNKIDRNSLAEWTKTHPTTPSDIESFMPVLSQTDGKYGPALQHLIASGQQDKAANVAAFLGGPDNIKIHDDYITAQAEQRKTDIQTQAQLTRQQNKEAEDQAAQEKKQEMINSLETAKIPDNILSMNPHDVIQNLQNQGVTLSPQVIRDAMAIANYEAPLSVAASRLWFKDPNATQQDILDVVKTFNPGYDVGSFDKLKQFEMPNSPASKTFQASAAVANHLNLLLDVAKAVKSGAGQYPLINKLENELNYHTGGSDYVRLAALTNAINGELGKVLSGGFAPQKDEIDAIMKNMNSENSLNQIQSLVGLYTGVMHGKIAPYDEQFNQLSGASNKHIKTIPSSTTKLFQRYGYDTPWNAQSQNQQQQQQQENQQPNPNEKPVIVNGKTIGYTVDGKTISRVAQSQ